MTLFADIIKVRIEMWSNWIRVGPESNPAGVLIRREAITRPREHGKEGYVMVKQTLERCNCEPKKPEDRQKPLVAGRNERESSSLEASEGAGPCWHLDFGLTASRMVAEWISVVWSHCVCGSSLRRSQETKSESLWHRTDGFHQMKNGVRRNYCLYMIHLLVSLIGRQLWWSLGYWD